MTGREQTGGGGTYHRWRGSKTVFGEGLYGMFSPPLSLPPPFVFLMAESKPEVLKVSGKFREPSPKFDLESCCPPLYVFSLT